MEITKALNNNMVLARDTSGRECICSGKGIGFGKRRGDTIDDSAIERRFVLGNASERQHYIELFSEIPGKYWQIAIDTADYGRNHLKLKFSDSVILTLTDHIAGAVSRYKEHVTLTNPLLYDIQQIYSQEFKCGRR